MTCVFDERDNKVTVTQGYITDLQQKVERLERSRAGLSLQQLMNEADNEGNETQQGDPPESLYDEEAVAESNSERNLHSKLEATTPADVEAPGLTNPLTAMPSRFMSANGRAFYLGTSSNWSFTRRVLSVTHEHIYKTPIPTDSLLFDGLAYDLDSDRSAVMQCDEALVMPSIDHALFLINATKFHCGQLYHLFEEEEFMEHLHKYYAESSDHHSEGFRLWQPHFLLLLAFGKSFMQKRDSGNKPAGSSLFLRALQLLPDVITLCREPLVSAEILCCIALYFQALDFRHAAHNFIGQAKSMAMNHGMHTDMPVCDLGEQVVQRCRRIWWTVYILDRQMTSLMGLPQSGRDEGVNCQLPDSPGSARRTATLSMQIKFARVLADISWTVYGTNGRLHNKFVVSTKAVLESIAGVADDLHKNFPLKNRLGGFARMSAHLYLLYYQCIVLATRPLLLCCLIKRFDSPHEADSILALPKVRNPLQMCIESAQQILNILETLHQQDILETFLPTDLDVLFISIIVLLVAHGVDNRLLESLTPWLQKSYTILDEMISSGNRVADFRKREVQKLEDMMRHCNSTFTQASPEFSGDQRASRASPTASRAYLASRFQRETYFAMETTAFQAQRVTDDGSRSEELTTDQIIAVANSIGTDDSEWLSFVTGYGSVGLDAIGLPHNPPVIPPRFGSGFDNF